VAPELSLAYWPVRTLKLRASVGFGYKAPAFLEVYGLGGVTGNPNLKPERNVGWDVGVEYWGAFAWPLLRVTYFDNRFEDIITFVQRPAPSLTTKTSGRAPPTGPGRRTVASSGRLLLSPGGRHPGVGFHTERRGLFAQAVSRLAPGPLGNLGRMGLNSGAELVFPSQTTPNSDGGQP